MSTSQRNCREPCPSIEPSLVGDHAGRPVRAEPVFIANSASRVALLGERRIGDRIADVARREAGYRALTDVAHEAARRAARVPGDDVRTRGDEGTLEVEPREGMQ